MNVPKLLQQALQLHQAGQLADAGEIYKSVLQQDPDNADALNLMGVILQAAGDLDGAIKLITRATEVAPDFAAPFVNLGNALQLAGRVDEAVDAFRSAATLAPDQAEAVNNLASALNELGRHEEALEACLKAIELTPRLGAAHTNMGNALAGLERLDEALESYEKALEIDPADSNAYYNLGNAYSDLGDLESALEHYRKSVSLDASNAEKHYNHANTALALDLYEDAVDGFERALAIDPDYIDAHCNLGATFQKMNRTGEAIGYLERALQSEPDSPDLHWNLSLALLQHGDYERGWREYEWRWKTPTFAAFQRDFGKPQWQGEDLDGRTILIDAEQGFGDGIQFSRYAPMVAERGGRVILECRAQLNRLFGTLGGIDDRIDLGRSLPDFDLHVPLMSLPHIFATTAETIPDQVPYLAAPEGTPVDSRIGGAEGLKIGFAWAGSPTRVDNHKRSCQFDLFEPLFEVPGTSFFSLQVGSFQEQLIQSDAAARVVDLADDLGDFGDTAAAIEALDLIISVDTSVLHLAGALGKPAWGLMSKPTGFLWQSERQDSPWYPTIRLFRQHEPGDWGQVFEAVGEELAGKTAKA